MKSGTFRFGAPPIMLNDLLTRLRRFSIKSYETVFQSSGLCAVKGRISQEAVVIIFGMIGLAFAALCVIASMSSTAREPSV
jgi:hypothetical protein